MSDRAWLILALVIVLSLLVMIYITTRDVKSTVAEREAAAKQEAQRTKDAPLWMFH